MQKVKLSSDEAAVQFWERMDSLIGGDKPYPWAVRHGLNRSAFQSARERGNKPLSKTVAKWAANIGCSYEWLNSGEGEPYPAAASEQQTPEQFKTSPGLAPEPTIDTPQDLVDLEILTKSIRTLEIALQETRRTMSPEKKAALIASLYALYSGSTHDDETMQKTITQLIRSAA